MRVKAKENQVKAYSGIATMPGYEMFEYQLVLAVPESLKEKVRRVRSQFAEVCKVPPASGSVLLPLVKFRQRALLEERLRFSLGEMITGWCPFLVQLKDFEAQPTHSIFIPVANKNLIRQHINDLKTIQHLLRPDKEHAAFFSSEHRLYLATKLNHGAFERGWKEYSHRQFTAQFIADACLLLKRKDPTLPWQIAQRFEMRNLPVGIKQGTLFQ